jgi:hypothetical protein
VPRRWADDWGRLGLYCNGQAASWSGLGIRHWPRGQRAGPGSSSIRLPPMLQSEVFLCCWGGGSAVPGDPRSGYLIYDDSRHPCDMDPVGLFQTVAGEAETWWSWLCRSAALEILGRDPRWRSWTKVVQCLCLCLCLCAKIRSAGSGAADAGLQRCLHSVRDWDEGSDV